MIITKEQCLNLFKEIGLDNAAMDLGLSLGQMSIEDNEESWKNIVEAVKKFSGDEEEITDFILDTEYYESK